MYGMFGLVMNVEIDKIRVCMNRRQSHAMTTWVGEYVVVMNVTHHDVTNYIALKSNITQYTALELDLTHLIITLKNQMH